MNPARWFEGLPSASTPTLVALAVAILGGILASAFAMGGLWALRGRAALRVPECKRCRSLLRGKGLEVPALCSECGADLSRRGAVRWLRFRRQPTTFLITAPVVLLGGSVLALFCAGTIVIGVGSFFGDLDRMAAARRRLAEPTRTKASSPVIAMPADSDEWSDPSLARDIASARAGGREGLTAFSLLAARARELVTTESSAVVTAVKQREAEALHGFLRDFLAGATPSKPYPTDTQSYVWNSRQAPPVQAVQALQWMARHQLITREDLLADTARFRASVRALAPTRVAPGTTVPFHLWCDPVEFLPDLAIDGVRLGSATVYRRRHEGEIAACRTPQREGSVRYDIGWSLGEAEGGIPNTKEDVGRLRGVVTVEVELTGGPGRFASAEGVGISAASTLDSQETLVLLSRFGGRDGLWWSVRSVAEPFSEFAGSWTLEAGDTYELGSHDGPGNARGSVLIRPPAAGWPDAITLRFTPRADLLGELSDDALPEGPFLRWTEPLVIRLARSGSDDTHLQYHLVPAKP